MDIENIKQRLDIRNRERRIKLAQRQEYILNNLRECIPELVKNFSSVSKVIVFGSLATSNKFNELSDIDVAVNGLSKSDYFRFHLWLEKLLQFEDIDVIRLEEIEPKYKKRIDRGILLYEKEI